MGCFKVRFKVGRVAGKGRTIELEGTVDTGAAFPFVPSDILGELGIRPTDQLEFELADGSTRRLPVGEARFHYHGKSAPCLVVFGLPGTEPLFGALALESLLLKADPVNLRLEPVKRLLAAAG